MSYLSGEKNVSIFFIMNNQIKSRFHRLLNLTLKFQQSTETPDQISSLAPPPQRTDAAKRIWERHLKKNSNLDRGQKAYPKDGEELQKRVVKQILSSHRARYARRARIHIESSGKNYLTPSWLTMHPFNSLGNIIYSVLSNLIVRPVSRFILNPIYLGATYFFTPDSRLKKDLVKIQLYDEIDSINEIIYQISLKFSKIRLKKASPLNSQEKEELIKIIDLACNFFTFNATRKPMLLISIKQQIDCGLVFSSNM